MRKKKKFERAKFQVLRHEKITSEEKTRWSYCLHQVWQSIGDDIEVALEQSGQKLTSDILIEVCLDANRPEQFSAMTDEETWALYCMSHQRPVKKWLKEVLNY